METNTHVFSPRTQPFRFLCFLFVENCRIYLHYCECGRLARRTAEKHQINLRAFLCRVRARAPPFEQPPQTLRGDATAPGPVDRGRTQGDGRCWRRQRPRGAAGPARRRAGKSGMGTVQHGWDCQAGGTGGDCARRPGQRRRQGREVGERRRDTHRHARGNPERVG